MTNKITMFFNGQPIGEAKEVVITCADPLNLDAQDDRRFIAVDPGRKIEPVHLHGKVVGAMWEGGYREPIDLESFVQQNIEQRTGIKPEMLRASFGTPDHLVNASDAIAVNTVKLPRGGMMVSGSADQLRAYVERDLAGALNAAAEAAKRTAIEMTITEALHMQARGRSAPEPRPKPMAMYVFSALLNWSQQ